MATKRKRNYVSRLKNGEGLWFESTEGMEKIVLHYYKELSSTEHDIVPAMADIHIPTLNHSDRGW